MSVELRDDRVSGLAAEIALFGLLAFFPTLLALAAALGSLQLLFGDDLSSRAEEQVVDFFERILTSEASGTVDAAKQLFTQGSPGVLAVGSVVALWAMSRGFAAVVRGLDQAYDLDEARSWASVRLTALTLALGSVVVGAAVLTMLVLGPLLGTGGDLADDLGLGGAFTTFWTYVRWPLVLAVMVAWATVLFHVAPNHRTPFRWDVPGALLATVGWVLATVGLRVYLVLATSANQFFGFLGGALTVILWLYLLAFCLLVGGELNSILIDRHDVPRWTDSLVVRLRRRRAMRRG